MSFRVGLLFEWCIKCPHLALIRSPQQGVQSVSHFLVKATRTLAQELTATVMLEAEAEPAHAA